MMKRKIYAATILLIIVFLAACQPDWQIELTEQGQAAGTIKPDDVLFYMAASEEEVDVIPLGQMLYANGFSLVERIRVVTDEKQESAFVWDEIASTSFISSSGKMTIEGNEYSPSRIDVTPSIFLDDIDISIMNIAPTMADALGLPNLPDSQMNALILEKAQYGVMIVLDGLQYEKLDSMMSSGKLPFLASVNDISQGLTVYPPITSTATAAVLTGTPPGINGVYGYGYRSTEMTTLFDLAVDSGKRVVAVEGPSLSFNLRNAETILSDDRDGNGYSDDNVYKNSLEVIRSDMPDLLFIHFHEIDDMGHTYGPDSSEYEGAAMRVDEYLSKIYQELPGDTLIAIFADHGMHTTEGGGNHGTLTEPDLVIPIMFLEK